MKVFDHPENPSFRGISLNLAVVGGGQTCQRLLQRLRSGSLPFLQINIVGVCDIRSDAAGLRTAKEWNIYTTDDFTDFYQLEALDGIIELTNRRDVLLDLVRSCPGHIGIVQYPIGRLLISLLELSQKQLKSAEEEVKLEQSISDFLMQLKNEPIIILNPDFTIGQVNSAFLDIVQKARDEVVGSYCYQVIYGYNVHCATAHPDHACPMLETLRTGESARVIHESSGTSTGPSIRNVVAYPIKNRLGQIVKVIEIWQDITEDFVSHWEKHTRELKDNLNKLVQEDRMVSLGKLAASCVHEINNPIQGLLTISRLMQDTLGKGQLSPFEVDTMKHDAALMTAELERCGNIVAGLLSFSRETVKDYLEIDLRQILESVLALTRHRIKLSDIELVCRIAENDLLVRGDKNQLQQCFLNLLFNAVEAMPDGGTLTVRAEENRFNKSARIVIRDTGYGIAQEAHKHIFEPFYTTKGDAGGTGLGLSIVHGVVKSHGGDVRVTSRLGQGTTFILSFPLHSHDIRRRTSQDE